MRQRELAAAFKWEVAQALKLAVASYNKGFRGGVAVHTFLHDYTQQLPLAHLQHLAVAFASPAQQRLFLAGLALAPLRSNPALVAKVLQLADVAAPARPATRQQVGTHDAVGALYVRRAASHRPSSKRQLSFHLPAVVSAEWPDYEAYWAPTARAAANGGLPPLLAKVVAAEQSLRCVFAEESPVCEY